MIPPRNYTSVHRIRHPCVNRINHRPDWCDTTSHPMDPRIGFTIAFREHVVRLRSALSHPWVRSFSMGIGSQPTSTTQSTPADQSDNRYSGTFIHPSAVGTKKNQKINGTHAHVRLDSRLTVPRMAEDVSPLIEAYSLLKSDRFIVLQSPTVYSSS
jgi:hypothetical protein